MTGVRVGDYNVYSTGQDGTFVVWRKSDLSHLKTISIPDVPLSSIEIDRNYLYVGSTYMDSVVRVWNRNGYNLVDTLENDRSPIQCIKSLGELLFACDSRGTARIWDKSDFSCVKMLDVGQPILLSITADTSYIYVGGIGNQTNVYSRDDYSLIAELTGHHASVFSLEVNNDYVFSGSGELWWGGPGSPRPSTFESAIRMWKKDDWRCIALFEGHSDNINALAVDGEYLYSVSDDSTLRVYRISDQSSLAVIDFDGMAMNDITLDQDSVYIACRDRTVRKIPKSALTEI
ncbi:MAG: hypothetical protein RTU30_09920 [Candidatus Thorarchaeota archaeon]